jgi:triosephosphate isomerase
MKSSLIVGNWKMYVTSIADAHILATSIRNGVADIPRIEAVICPPALWLSEIAGIVRKGAKTKIGIQNVSYEKEGAFTGEISPLMAKEMAEYAIIGHSERRAYFGETDVDVNEKVLAALKVGLTPIICVGEKKKEATPTEPFKQLEEALKNVPKNALKNIVVAYEPIWAIGTSLNADAEYVAKVVTKLRELVHADTAILYGGSVKLDNALRYAQKREIGGLLIGGTSVKANDFIKICKIWSIARDIK